MEKHNIAHYCYSLLVLVLGTALFLTALPRVRAALNHLPVAAAISELNRQKSLDPKKVNSLIATAQHSITLDDEPRYFADLSGLLFAQVEKITVLSLKRPSLKLTQYNIEQSLARSPANSLLWFQLAKLHFLLNTISDKTIKALNLSIMTGPYELGHLLPRLQLCLWLLPKFDSKDRFLLSSQILIAWEKSPKLFIKEIALKNNNMTKIQLLLQDNSADILAAMETEIEKTH